MVANFQQVCLLNRITIDSTSDCRLILPLTCQLLTARLLQCSCLPLTPASAATRGRPAGVHEQLMVP